MKSTIQISRTALLANFRAIQHEVGSDVEVLAVVKANAYGHGVSLCAAVLAEAGARWFGVSDASEGAEVRKVVGPDPEIVVMCGSEPADAPLVFAHRLTPVVWTAEHVRAFEDAAITAGTSCSVHVEIDTGMSRQGCAPGDDLASTLKQLQKATRVRCEGAMSHLCCAEVAGAEITREQAGLFAVALEQIWAAGFKPKYVHLCNSSAIDEGNTLSKVQELAHAHSAAVMVRPGLALYGHLLPLECEESPSSALLSRLKPVLTWTTHIIGLREIRKGSTVGYGATFVAPHGMRLALLPVGYAEGFRRAASSSFGDGWVMIADHRAPVVGRVSMNLTVVDVSGIPHVGIGDEVVLLGPGVTVEDHARWSNTIAYEILCGVRGNHRLVDGERAT